MYVVREQVRGVRPSLRRTAVPSRAMLVAPGWGCGPEPEIQPIDLVGQSLGDILGVRLGGLRVGWSQVTFYLFDPQSWR
jgi:hypothetical protein